MELKQLEGIKTENNYLKFKTGIIFVFGLIPDYSYHMIKGSKLVKYEFREYKKLIIIDCTTSQSYTKTWQKLSPQEKMSRIFNSYIVNKGVNVVNQLYPHIMKAIVSDVSSAIAVAGVTKLPLISLSTNENKKECYSQLISEFIKCGLMSESGMLIPNLQSELTSSLIKVPDDTKRIILPQLFVKLGGNNITSLEQVSTYLSDNYWLYYLPEEVKYSWKYWDMAMETYIKVEPAERQNTLSLFNSFGFFRPILFESIRGGFPVFFSIDGIEFKRPILYAEDTSLRTYYNIFVLSSSSYFSLYGCAPQESYKYKMGPSKFKETAIIKSYGEGLSSVTFNDNPIENFSIKIKEDTQITSIFCNDLLLFPKSSMRKFVYNIESHSMIQAFITDIDNDSVLNNILSTLVIPDPFKEFYNLLRSRGSLTFFEVENLGLKRKDLLSLSSYFKFYMINHTGYKFWFSD